MSLTIIVSFTVCHSIWTDFCTESAWLNKQGHFQLNSETAGCGILYFGLERTLSVKEIGYLTLLKRMGSWGDVIETLWGHFIQCSEKKISTDGTKKISQITFENLRLGGGKRKAKITQYWWKVVSESFSILGMHWLQGRLNLSYGQTKHSLIDSLNKK